MRKILSRAAIDRLPDEERRQAAFDRTMSPAARRLDALKAKAEKSRATILANHAPGDYRDSLLAQREDWRSHRYPRHYGSEWSDDRTEFYIDEFPAGWRQLGRADEVAKREGAFRTIDHNGWYVDAYQSETVAGYVLQLPARNGRPRYIPALKWSDRDGVTLYPAEWSDEPLGAAIQADRIAERVAEKERDYNEAWQAGARYSDLAAEIADTRRDALLLCEQFRDARRTLEASHNGATAAGFERLCASIRADIVRHVESIRDARAERAKLLEAARWQRDAFNDGAGLRESTSGAAERALGIA